MKDLKQLLEIIKSEKIDILFLNNFDGLFLFKFMRSPVVVIQMVHDYFWICPKILKLIQLYQEDTICTHPFGPACFENKCLSYLSTVGLLEVMRRYFYVDCLSKIPAQIVCASSFIKEAYAQNGIPHQKVNVVPLFIDPKRQTHGLDETKRRILFVGRISYEKGLSYLLKALAGLSDFELDVIGEGEDVSSNKVLAQKFGLQEKVNFRGWMSHSAIEHLMDEARLVVLPSIWPEPFGMVGLEAMASGKAVVAFDVGGVREWLKDSQNGFLVPNKDIHQLKEKINLLLRDERIALEMGKAGKELINNFFSTQKYVNRLTEVFKKALTTSK